MRKLSSIFSVILFFCISSCQSTANVEHEDSLTSSVNVFIGTGGHGHTFPGAAYPFGQIQLSPDNLTGGWDWCSGYHDSDSTIVGFSHLHLSGTGIGDLYDISVLPTSENVVYKDGESNIEFISRYMGIYDKKDEFARPGFYSVNMKNTDIRAELTVSERAGFHKYIFPEAGENNVIFNLGFAKNWDATVETSFTIRDKQLVTGVRKSTGWSPKQHVFFAARFSEPMTKSNVFETGSEELKVGVFSFENHQVLMKVGISTVSEENAIANLDASLKGWNFEDAVADANLTWEKELSNIRIETPNTDTKTIFYTAMYHTMLAPSLFSDLTGEFKGVNGQTEVAKGYNRYNVFSLWDTYRALHPLYTITQPSRVNDMVKSMLDHYDQTGALPIWELAGTENNCMVGNHSISVIGEAIVKNIGDFDREHAFEAMKNTSMRNFRGMKFHDELGYIPSDKENESVAKALEYCIDDWAAAAAAKVLGKTDDYEYFLNRSMNYKNYWDAETQFLRGKLQNGSWRTPFNPIESAHRTNDYTEGNAWQYLWLVPQDVDGLIDLFGGKKSFASKLDELFNLEEGLSGEHASPDISGLIGAYAHGNEPGHHTIYMFNNAGEYGKTQSYIHRVYKEMYKNAPDGLAGNEDCGQMSAWYVLSSMGIYPVNPSEAVYQIGSPAVGKATITLPNGKEFIMTAEGLSDENIYIQSAKLNGETLNISSITHKQLLNGGRLEFVMGAMPSTTLFQ